MPCDCNSGCCHISNIQAARKLCDNMLSCRLWARPHSDGYWALSVKRAFLCRHWALVTFIPLGKVRRFHRHGIASPASVSPRTVKRSEILAYKDCLWESLNQKIPGSPKEQEFIVAAVWGSSRRSFGYVSRDGLTPIATMLQACTTFRPRSAA
jgi:hypothetical protein